MQGTGDQWLRNGKDYRNRVSESKYHVVKVES